MPVAKKHRNVVEDALPFRTVARRIRTFNAGQTETADLHSTGRQFIPQHHVYIVSGFLPLHRGRAVRELSVEI